MQQVRRGLFHRIHHALVARFGAQVDDELMLEALIIGTYGPDAKRDAIAGGRSTLPLRRVGYRLCFRSHVSAPPVSRPGSSGPGERGTEPAFSPSAVRGESLRS